MRLFAIFSALIFQGSFGLANSIQDFVQSDQFNQFCESTVVAKPPFQALDRKWNNFYILKNPSFVQHNGVLYFGIRNGTKELPESYSIYRTTNSNEARMEEFTQLEEPAIDLLIHDGYLYAIGKSTITKILLSTSQVTKADLPQTLDVSQFGRPFDMEMINDKLFVSMGSKGLWILDPRSFKVERVLELGLQQANGHKSMATSMARISEHEIVVGIDNQTLPTPKSQAFNGLMVLNLHSFDIRKLPMTEGIFSRQSKMLYDGKTLWINNAGVLQHINLGSFEKSASVTTDWVNLTFEKDGKFYWAEPRGDFMILNNEFISCAVQSQIRTQKPEPKKGIVLRVPFNSIKN